MRVKICRKEAKESRLFLRLIDAGSSQNTASAPNKLAAEARELTLILSAIISKSERSHTRILTLMIEICLGFGT